MKRKTDDDRMVREEDAAITAENLKIEAAHKAESKNQAEKVKEANRVPSQPKPTSSH